MTICPAGPQHKNYMQQDWIKLLNDNWNLLKQEGTLAVVTRAHGNVSADVA